MQERLGVRDIEDWARKVVHDYLPEQHRAFHTSQPFLVVSARDDVGRPWVTLLNGPDGFVTSPDPRHLVIKAKPTPDDALENAFVADADVGILGIELATRRRNRVNGRVTANGSNTITFRVDQSFGNCPQYIREREWQRVSIEPSAKVQRSTGLSATQREWIEAADTLFIASGFRGDGESPTFGMDASHRGGERGFVRVLDDTRLRFPDYAGNNHYNTIGNLVLDPRVGYLFIDFETGSLLQISGKASIDWDSAELQEFPGARRLVTLEVDEIIELSAAVGLRWEADAESVRSLRLVEKTSQSNDVTSFVFEARDGGLLATFEPGQHLPIELSISGVAETARRTYSLSSPPSDERYRITVKREAHGLVSRHLHDNVEPGAIIESRRPAGDFMMTCNVCPLVLVSAGVGVTLLGLTGPVPGKPETSGKDLFLCETIGTDLVTIRVTQIGGVGRRRKRTWTGLALIATSIGKTRCMKLVHCIATWRGKTECTAVRMSGGLAIRGVGYYELGSVRPVHDRVFTQSTEVL